MPIVPHLWYKTSADLKAATGLYVSLFPDSRVTSSVDIDAGERGVTTIMSFVLMGTEFEAMNGANEFAFNESISFRVSCRDQAEVDRYWDALSADGGEEQPCGWLKDRWGLSWQIIPETLGGFLGDPDPARAARARDAMFQMRKIDIAAIERAASGAA